METETIQVQETATESAPVKEHPTVSPMAVILWALGVIAIVLGLIAMLSDLQAENGSAVRDLAGAITGVLFVAFGSIVDKLSRIEYHLRPVEPPKPKTAPILSGGFSG